ncbi:MAG: hypothetical protein ACREQI_02210 [Candidatus Binataceae bacterium]
MPRFWLIYEMGIQGDYSRLYEWLDRHQAKECGEGAATFVLKSTQEELGKQLAEIVKKEDRARLYLIGKKKDGPYLGSFIFGKRKRPSWVGSAELAGGVDQEE